MKVAVTGASGLIGSALTRSLRRDGHEVLRLVRRRAKRPDEVAWDPARGTVDLAGLAGVHAVVHLAGAGVGDHRWTASYKRQIRDSRVLGTGAVARAVAELDPQPRVLVSASAVGWYGDTGDNPVDERSRPGKGFLPEVVAAWERAADPARDVGVRVVHPRSGLVVARRGGAWGRMWPVFRLGLGGRFGNGAQFWSFVSLHDEIAVLRTMIDDVSMSGAYNVTAPNPATNAEITEAMGRLLHRPTFLHVPGWALRAALGEMSQEILGSSRVLPHRLTVAGYTFAHPRIEYALRAALSGAGP